jgi:hypothetical protein
MKKTILFLLALIFTSSIYSQIKIGLNAGATYSKLYGKKDATDSPGYKGFLIGASFEYYLNESLSLKTNLNYERTLLFNDISLTDKFGIIIGQVELTSNFDYLNIPIMAKYEFGNSKKFFVNGGPFLGFLLSTKTKGKSKVSDFNTSYNNEGLKKINVGLSFGIGMKVYSNDKSDLNIELRENLGLLNIDNGDYGNENIIKTNYLNLILNWSFGI